MNHIENYRDKTHEHGWALTPKVPTFRRNCLAHILSEDNIGTESGGRTEVWGGPLEGGDFVVGLVNRWTSALNITARLGLLMETNGVGIPRMGGGTVVINKIRDLWGRREMSVKDTLDLQGNVHLEVPSHDIILLRIHIANTSQEHGPTEQLTIQ